MSDYSYGYSSEHQPVTYWRGYPVYAAHFVVIVYVALMIVTAVGGPAMAPVLGALGFDSARVLGGQVWRVLTYGLFNFPSLNFALDMVMLVWFGREVEKAYGRRPFFALYGGIYVLPTLLLTAVGLWQASSRMGQPGTLAVFVAFAAIYPGVPMLFNILAKWAALAFVGLFSLMALAARDWVSLLLLWSTCGYAYAFVQYQRGVLVLPSFRLPAPKPKLRVLPDLPVKTAAAAAAAPRKAAPLIAPVDTTMSEVDALLDKIASSGIGSLTAQERAKLEAARQGLRQRGK
jgi:hypothetical protein